MADTAPIATPEPAAPSTVAPAAAAAAEPAPVAPAEPAAAPARANAEPAPASPLVDVAALDAARRQEEPAPATAPAATADPKLWSELVEALGEVPDAPNPTILAGIDRKMVEKMAPEARALLRHILAERNGDRLAAAAADAAARKKLDDDRAALEAESDAFLQQRGQFAAIVGSDAYKALLAGAQPKPGEPGPDPFTKEGVAEIARRTAAAAAQQFFQPLVDESSKVRQRVAYHRFVSGHPRMNDAGFRGEVRKLVEERTVAGNPIELADAHDLVEGRLLLREENARRDSERKARAASMEHVVREPASSHPDTGASIPKDIFKTGYKGYFGFMAEVAYAKDHPNVIKAMRHAVH